MANTVHKFSEQVIDLAERLADVADAANGKGIRKGGAARWLLSLQPCRLCVRGWPDTPRKGVQISPRVRLPRPPGPCPPNGANVLQPKHHRPHATGRVDAPTPLHGKPVPPNYAEEPRTTNPDHRGFRLSAPRQSSPGLVGPKVELVGIDDRELEQKAELAELLLHAARQLGESLEPERDLRALPRAPRRRRPARRPGRLILRRPRRPHPRRVRLERRGDPRSRVARPRFR